MENGGNHLHSQKITVEIAVRLIVKVSGEQIPLPEDPGVRVWKLNPVWKVSMSADTDPQFTFENTNPNSRDVVWRDGHAVATEFLGLKSPEDTLAFFKKYNWYENKQLDADKKIRIRWTELQGIQKAFASVLRNEPIEPQNLQEFIFQPLPVNLTHHEGTFHKNQSKENRALSGKSYFDTSGIAECADVLSALRAITFLSRGVVWRLCANPKCDHGLFKPARPNQMYHDAACTHRAMANRHSEKTRKAKTKRRRK
ncbi:MAG TPA: hypothetical protein VN087_02720 [Verrucomicrobiae bacterium]|jgi:hypothetical protein|nr:hypothetical protein [Verrucomicrobiae bacterium]